MSLIIDGYNLLFAIAEHGPESSAEAIEAARRRLIGQLDRYARSVEEQVTLIFDSRQQAGGATREQRRRGVRIRYTHPPRTADDDIERMVAISRSPRTLCVVTSDRALADACRKHGAEVIGARAFQRQLGATVAEARDDEDEQRIKNQPPSDDEVREFLDAFGEEDEG
jgi:predicted RNA-binding protein with PIN domain